MKNFLTLILSIDGCVGRQVWWLSHIVFCVAVFTAAILEKFLFGYQEAGPVVWTVIFVLLWPMLAIQVKRWHDRGKSGLWCFINVIPFIGPIWAFIELGLLGPTDDPTNEYYRGIDPWAEPPVPRIVGEPKQPSS